MFAVVVPGLAIAMAEFAESSPWGVVGLKFQTNGADDPSIRVSGFNSANGMTTAQLSVPQNARVGYRTLVLVLADGTQLQTSILLNVAQPTFLPGK